MAGTWMRMETPLEAMGSVDEQPIEQMGAVLRAHEAVMRLQHGVV